MPRDLQTEIAKLRPRATIVNLAGLVEDDQRFFEKDHGNACPGLTEVNFYGDGAPSIALLLAENPGTKERTELVVAHRVSDKWKIVSLETGNAIPSAPVIWSQKPGEYFDVYGNKTIRAKWPVIIFCKYEAWAIVYCWTGKRVDKVWIRD